MHCLIICGEDTRRNLVSHRMAAYLAAQGSEVTVVDSQTTGTDTVPWAGMASRISNPVEITSLVTTPDIVILDEKCASGAYRKAFPAATILRICSKLPVVGRIRSWWGAGKVVSLVLAEPSQLQGRLGLERISNMLRPTWGRLRLRGLAPGQKVEDNMAGQTRPRRTTGALSIRSSVATAETAPVWLQAAPCDRPSLVLMPRSPAESPALLSALRPMRANQVLICEPDDAKVSFGTLPLHVYLKPRLDLASAARHLDAAIVEGNLAEASAALSCGLPVVFVAGTSREEIRFARCLNGAGLGVGLFSHAGLLKAVTRVTTEHGFKRKAAAHARRLSRLPQPEIVLGEILENLRLPEARAAAMAGKSALSLAETA